MLPGIRLEADTALDAIGGQLARINEQLVIKNRRARRSWTAVAVIIGAGLLLQLLVIGSVILLRVDGNTSIEETAYWSATEETVK